MPVTGTILLVTSIVSAGASVGGAAASAKQTRLRREYEANMQLLNKDEKKALEERLLKEKTIEGKRQILADTLSDTAMLRIKNLQERKAQVQKTTDTLLIIGSITLLLMISAVIVYKSNK